jgi:hypothetical protein
VADRWRAGRLRAGGWDWSVDRSGFAGMSFRNLFLFLVMMTTTDISNVAFRDGDHLVDAMFYAFTVAAFLVVLRNRWHTIVLLSAGVGVVDAIIGWMIRTWI